MIDENQENISDSNSKIKSSTNDIELIKKSSLHWEIILNRPNKYNAITNDMYDCLTKIFNEAANDKNLILLSLTGKGVYYSSGTDLTNALKLLNSSTTDNIETIMDQGKNRLKNFIESLINFPKLLIAFVNGPAIGISVSTLALFDGVYASSNATFSLPFTETAQSAEGCSSYLYPFIMGSIHAKDLLLFNKKLNAFEAEQRGLVTKVIQNNLFQQEKDKICQYILSLPKQSLLRSKALINKWLKDKLYQINSYEIETLQKSWTDEEYYEAMFKFINRKQKSNL